LFCLFFPPHHHHQQHCIAQRGNIAFLSYIRDFKISSAVLESVHQRHGTVLTTAAAHGYSQLTLSHEQLTTAANRHLDVVKTLFAMGARADYVSNGSITPLITACRGGHEEVASAIVRHLHGTFLLPCSFNCDIFQTLSLVAPNRVDRSTWAVGDSTSSSSSSSRSR